MKKLFSFVCALVCAMSLSAKEFYLVPNSNWLKDNARFAIYAYHGTGDNKVETWVGMTAVEGATGNYRATVDDAYTTLIFCRMKPDKPENNWDNKWNQTGDLKDWGDNDCFTLTENSWDAGTWSKYVHVEDVFTVAGAATLFGSEWSASDTTNDMVKQEDGTYKWEKKNVTLSAGKYTYKVVVNHSWNPELMSNQTITIEKSGVHDITIIYNAKANTVSDTATLTKAEEVDPVIQLKGQFDNDSVSKWIVKDMALAADKKTASTTLTLTARTIEMGILLDGNWNSNGKEIKPSSNTITLTEPGEGNIRLYAPEEGEYIFTYTLESKTLVVTFPEGATDPLPVLNLFGSWDGWKAGTLFTPAANKLTATATLTLDAGDYTFKVTKDAAWMTNDNSGTMTRVNSKDWPFVEGEHKAATGLKADAKGEYTFTWTYEGDKLTVTFPAATATDLIGADSDSKAVKIVRDGQLLIVRDGVTYNMMGSVVK